MKAGWRKWTAVTVFICFMAAGICHGRVFLRGGRSSAGSGAGVSGERLAYSSSVVINGGAGALQVYGSGEDFGTAVRRIRAEEFAGKEKDLLVGKSLACGIRTANSKVIRVLLSPTDHGCAIFRIEQAEMEFQKSRGTQSPGLDGKTPVYPGSVHVFSLKNDDTRTSIEVCSSFDAPGSINEFFRSTLDREGWKPSAATIGEAPGMSLFRRGRNLCCFVVAQQADERVSMIVVLHKEMSKAEQSE